MLPSNNISERLLDLKREMNELTASNLRYRSQGYHTQQRKAAQALRRDRLLAIKQEFSNMINRWEQSLSTEDDPVGPTANNCACKKRPTLPSGNASPESQRVLLGFSASGI
jgi:hypothetical protein